MNVGRSLYTAAGIASEVDVDDDEEEEDDDDDDDDDTEGNALRIKNNSALLVVSTMHDDESEVRLLISILSTTEFSPATSWIPGMTVEVPEWWMTTLRQQDGHLCRVITTYKSSLFVFQISSMVLDRISTSPQELNWAILFKSTPLAVY